ncbi:MAG TPA: efflux RND transporter permease subunit [Candidatus Sabulitectum sp.]|nr:efflux RND transporter permease subunit [Candidatus Sabulitectum sp.]HPJ27330.1 efflux RND transporter permease subunit [Candidatus Sabulitectum sp.]HPR21113.1 efflux RND transporter permease subunit [Candidatus Sabulitectum sp.]
MKLSAAAVARPVAVTVISLVAAVLGTIAVLQMPVDLLPSVEYPRITIETRYPSSSPYEVERLVTDPLEDALAGVRGLRSYTSRSYGDMSRITLEFDWGANMDYTRLEVREKLDVASWSLPDAAERPTIVDYDPSSRPFMEVLLTMDGGWTDITDFSRRVIATRIEQVDGVAACEIDGEAEPAVFVRLRDGVVEELDLNPATIAAALAGANAVSPGGQVRDGEKEFFLSLQGEFESLEDVRSTVVGTLGGTPLLLGAVADVYIAEKPPTEWASYNGERAIILRVRKMAEANTVEVAGLVAEVINELNESNEGMHLEIIQNDARFIEESIGGVVEALILGGLLAFGVLFFFLRDWKSPLILGLSLPLSISLALFFLYLAGVTVNIMSLGGLALGTGLLVDNAVVVLEAIYRRRELGDSRVESATKGTSEVGPAIVASTLTTIVVFFPVVYMEGITSQLFRDQALAVGSALLASLFVAVTVIPALAARIGKTKNAADVTASMKARYADSMNGILRRRKRVLLFTLIITAVAFFGASRLPMQLLPDTPADQLEMSFSAPEGTSMEQLVDLSARVSELALLSGAQWSSGRAGVRAEEGVDALSVAAFGDHRAASAAIEPIRNAWNETRSFPLQVGPRGTLLGEILGGGSGFTIYIEGESIDTDRQAAVQLAETASSELGEIVGTEVNYLPGKPEIVVRPQRELLHLLGIVPDDVADYLESLSRGIVATTYYRQDEKVDVMLLTGSGEGIPLDSLLSRSVGVQGRLLQVDRLVSTFVRQTPGFIEHYQGNRAVGITIQSSGTNMAGTAQSMERMADSLLASQPVKLRTGPEIEEMDRTASSLILAAILAVALVYVLLAVQFESFVEPFIIMITVPLGVIGVVLGLALFGQSWNALSGIGLVILSGIVVNDGILLVERISQLRREGLPVLQAVIDAGRDRFRPVLMTTVTTVLGLLPMAIGLGEGASLRQPLAIAVISGITVATVLTLVIVPVLYTLLVRDGRGV